MATPRKYKAGDVVRGLRLIEPSKKIIGKELVFSWICKNKYYGTYHNLTTAELSKYKKTPYNKLQSCINKAFTRYRIRCRQKNVYFELSKEQFYELSQMNCSYCELKPSNGKIPYMYSGLDRKEPKLGYTMQNVVPCCARCNGIKSDKLSYEEMKIAMDAIKKAKK